MIKRIFSYLILITLYIINVYDLYKVYLHIKSRSYRIGFTTNKICVFLILLIFTFLNINSIEMLFLALFSGLNNLIGISESLLLIRLLTILKEKKKYIFILTLIGLFLFIMFINYFYLFFLKNLLFIIYN